LWHPIHLQPAHELRATAHQRHCCLATRFSGHLAGTPSVCLRIRRVTYQDTYRRIDSATDRICILRLARVGRHRQTLRMTTYRGCRIRSRACMTVQRGRVFITRAGSHGRLPDHPQVRGAMCCCRRAGCSDVLVNGKALLNASISPPPRAELRAVDKVFRPS